MTRPRRVVLVREWRAKTAGGGSCCGGTAAPPADLFGPAPVGRDHENVRAGDACPSGVGPLYRSLREALPGTDVTVTDSSNWPWVVAAVLRDARRSGLTWSAAARQAARATTPSSVVVDGVVVVRGRLPSADEVLQRCAATTAVSRSS